MTAISGGDTTGRDHRDRATLPDPAALDALRAALADHRAGLPPEARDTLREELALLLDASGRHLGSLNVNGLLTRRGNVKAAYRAYAELQPRLERVCQLLGFEPEKPAAGKPSGVPGRVMRTLSPAARARMEEPS